ncbi:MAG: hypothetical protein DHS20C18_40360 [Saprospiraceae bacterium]|nr:MAG: hypothetical protein DHS20C18_40360 [Saprospiraceae bacterium]
MLALIKKDEVYTSPVIKRSNLLQIKVILIVFMRSLLCLFLYAITSISALLVFSPEGFENGMHKSGCFFFELQRVSRGNQEDKVEPIVYRSSMDSEQFWLEPKNVIRAREIFWVTSFTATLLFFLWILYVYQQKIKRLNAEIENRDGLLSIFTYVTSHDLKESVRNINNFALLAKRNLEKKKSNPQELELLGFVERGAKSIFGMIDSLNIYMESSSSGGTSELVELAMIFKSVKKKFIPSINEKNLNLQFLNYSSRKIINFPKYELELILENVIRNGVIFNKSTTPSVKVEVFSRGKRVLFKVTDNGIGINKEFHHKIFQPLQTLENKNIRQVSGLGLTICKNILDRHGKSIWVQSDGANGSSFYFFI